MMTRDSDPWHHDLVTGPGGGRRPRDSDLHRDAFRRPRRRRPADPSRRASGRGVPARQPDSVRSGPRLSACRAGQPAVEPRGLTHDDDDDSDHHH